MKPLRNAPSDRPCRGRILAIGTLLLVGAASPVLAKKGGKGGGGNGGGEDPPPPRSAPIHYSLTWLSEEPDSSILWDIDPDGVAVGQFRPFDSYADRYGIISFPGRTATDLGAIVAAGNHAGDPLPAGWALTSVYTISDGLLVSGDVVGIDGVTRCFAAQLSDDGSSTTVDWFRIHPAPANATQVYVQDASEDGDDFVLDVRSTGPGGENVREIHRWSPRDTPEVSTWVTTLSSTLVATSVNNAGQVCWSVVNQSRDVFVDDPVLGILDVDSDPKLSSNGMDIAESGAVVGGFTSSRRGGFSPGIWRLGTGWQELSGTSREKGFVAAVNSVEQVIGLEYETNRLFFHSNADGLHPIDELVIGTTEDLARWTDTLYYLSSSMSAPDGTGYGKIAGHAVVAAGGNDHGFILTPVPVDP